MNIQTILTLIGVQPRQPVNTVRQELLNEMASALSDFTRALQKYEAYLTNIDASLAYSQMLYAEVEVHRERYRNARLQYERLYGNLDEYNERLQRNTLWRKEMNLTCLFLPSEIATTTYTSDELVS